MGTLIRINRRTEPCAKFLLVGAIPNPELVEQARENHLADKENSDPRRDIRRRQRQHGTTGDQRKQCFGDLVEAGRPAASDQPEAALHEAGEEIAGHGENADQGTDRRREPMSAAPSDVTTMASTTPRMVFEWPSRGRPSRNLAPPSSGRARRSPSSHFAITGVPFASASSTMSCRTVQGCIAPFYASQPTAIDLPQGGFGAVSVASHRGGP